MIDRRILAYTKRLIKSTGLYKFLLYLVLMIILNLIIGRQPIIISGLFESDNSLDLSKIILLILTFISSGLINYPQNYMLQSVRKYSKVVIWEDINSRSYQELIEKDLGELQNLILEISFASRSLQYEGISFIINIIIIMSMYLIELLKFDNKVGFTFILFFAFYFYLSVKLSSQNSNLIQEVLNKSSEVNSFFLDYFNNLETVISFNNQKKENQKYSERIEDERKSYFQLQYKIDTSQLFLQFLLATFTGLLFRLIYVRHNHIEPRYGLIIIYTALNVNGFGKQVLSILESINRLGIALEKIEYGKKVKYNNYETDFKKDNNFIIKLNNVNFAYGDKNIITNFNLDICEGDRILIIGENGSGKSTIAKIIKGLVYPDSGLVEYFIDEDDIGYYSQKMTLFDRSLLDNMIYPEENKDILSYMWLLEFLKFLDVKNNDIEILKKRPGYFGEKLSGGERQKIILIRSVINSKDVIILDEIDSALDKVTKSKLQGLFENVFKDKTLIIISHGETFNKSYFNKVVEL